jgi:hypothetical protein
MSNHADPASFADNILILFDVSKSGTVSRLKTQGVPAWWGPSHADTASVSALLDLPSDSALTASIAGMHGSATHATGVEAIRLHGIGARLVRYRVQQNDTQTDFAYRVELTADAGLAALEELLAKLYKASHDLHTTSATVLASAQLLADAAPPSAASERNRDRIERAIRAALAADAENLDQARRKLAALGGALTRAT